MSYQQLIEDMARAIKCLEGGLYCDRVDGTTRISDFLNRHQNPDTSEKYRDVRWVGRNACVESPDLETWVTSALKSLHDGEHIQCGFDYVQYFRRSSVSDEENVFFGRQQFSHLDDRETPSPNTSYANLLEVANRCYYRTVLPPPEDRHRILVAGLFVKPPHCHSPESYVPAPLPSLLRKDYSEEDLERFKLEAAASVIDFYLLFHLLQSTCASSHLEELLCQDESDDNRLIALINFLDEEPENYRFTCIYDKFEQWRTLLFYTLGKRREIVPSSFIVDDIVPIGDQPVGRGGYADIWQASRIGDEIMQVDGTSSLVALKVLRTFKASSEQDPQHAAFLRALLREAFLWKKTNHTNVAQFIGICRVNDRRIMGSLALASPWMKNGNLLKYAKDKDSDEKYCLLAGVANGLIYLHTINIVHGDLKCANVLISDDGVAELSDFGLSYAGDGVVLVGGSGSSSGSGTFTNSAGNPRWLAPELIFPHRSGSSGKATRETDVYAFGMTALELFTGKVPFYGVPDVAIPLEVAIHGLKPQRPECIVESPSISEKVWNLMEMCWCHDASLRPKTLSPNSIFVDFAARSTDRIQINYRLPVEEDCTIGITGWYDGDFLTCGPKEFLGKLVTIGIDEASSVYILCLSSRTTHSCWDRNLCNYASEKLTVSRKYVCRVVGSAVGENYDWDWHLKTISRATSCHPNVVPFVGTCDIIPFLRTGLLFDFEPENHRPLIEVLLECKACTPHRLRIVAEVAEGLGYLHCSCINIVHGDLRCENIVVNMENKAVRLTDYAIPLCARLNKDLRDVKVFQAPEILRGSSIPTKESDIYSLGMVFYEIMTESLPFHCSKLSETELFDSITTEGLRPSCARSFSGGRMLFNKLRDIMMLCWSEDVIARPSALEFIKELETFAD